jgi:uncharacterized protein YjbI with pentapeptide repeats
LDKSSDEQSGSQLEWEIFMANAEQLSILKQGVQVWNGWRAKNIYVYADFNGADLNGVDLSKADLRISHFRRANLFRADLSGADLSGADLSDADLREANLREADLTKANLNGANLAGAFAREANLSQANLLAANLRNANFSHAHMSEANLMVAHLGGSDLSEANLSKTNFTRAQLSGVNLRRTDLSGARLTAAHLTKSYLLEARFVEADLIGTDFSGAKVGITVFANIDLSRVTGLESVDHRGPSPISMDTLTLSQGKIPEIFLRGCGLSDADIEYAKLSNPDLGIEEMNKILRKIHDLRAEQALQISPLFISYSHANSPFVDEIGSRLAEKGIRFWRDNHDMKAGKLEKQVERGIRQNLKVLLILSEQCSESDWVKRELTEVKKLEKEMGHMVLYPVALDGGWKTGRWPKRIMEQIMEYNLLDFSDWKNNGRFEDMFHNLIEGLELFDKG